MRSWGLLGLVPALLCNVWITGYSVSVSASDESPTDSRRRGLEIRKETVIIPMRDGVKLATDLYLPIGEASRWPVILRRTPYDRTTMESDARFYATKGYVAAVQDCRGLFDSEGTWEPFVNEPKETCQALEPWKVDSGWCRGNLPTAERDPPRSRSLLQGRHTVGLDRDISDN